MKRVIKKLTCCAFVFAACVSTPLFADDAAVAAGATDEKPWSVDMSVALVSDYMFRGQDLYDGSAIQPYVGGSYDTGYGKLGAFGWMHISADGSTNVQDFTELDLGINYEVDFKPLTFGVGNLWYTYPNDNDGIKDTAEVFFSVALDDSELNDFYTLSPKFTFYNDYKEIDYEYYELTLSHEYSGGSFGDDATLTPYVTFGFASNGEKVYAENGLEQVTEGLSLALPLGEMTVTPNLNYTHGIDDLARDQFWFGVTLGYSL